ncbi:MAG TPA: aldose epimerase family protein [Salinimicrobium sp.]|nr:aldose epimerase family protein [Salinimicrobium sp.]
MKKSSVFTLLIAIMTFTFFSCKNEEKELEESKLATQFNMEIQTKLTPEEFDTIIDGKQVKLFWIENDSIKAAFTNYGGRIIGLWVPDKNGEMTDVVIGMSSAEDYIKSTEPYFGATIGRVGNRIAKGKFTLDGKDYNITLNNNGNALHGGINGFQNVVWNGNKINDSTLIFTYKSPHMEEGFPGNLDVKVTYSLTNDRGLKMEYEAITDQSTPVNLTNHAFFNLNGEGAGTILDHRLRIFAAKFTPVDKELIPTGEFKPVAGTPFDFTSPHTIGERIDTENEQLKFGKGYDHNFVLNQKKVNGMNIAAKVIGDKSGIVMTILTEEPGLQFYSGNFMQGKNTLKTGAQDEFRTAFALETQHFPDSPNQPQFPSIILEPGEEYHTVSLYKFSNEAQE